MRSLYTLFLLFVLAEVNAQQQTYDLLSYTPPKGWNKTNPENFTVYSTTDNVKGTWAQIGIVKSTVSKGSIDADFKSEWKDLIINPYQQHGVSEQPLMIDTQTFKGWKMCSGLGKFVFNKDTAFVLLNTFSDGQRCISFTLTSNTTAYGKVLDEFVASVSLPKPNGSTATNTTATINVPPSNTGYQFSTTNFDDGWTSVVKEDWVEATKANIKVLLHYPNPDEREDYRNNYLDYAQWLGRTWDMLVAPRYSNLRNYEGLRNNYSDQPGYYAAGLLKDNASGKDVWVTLFKKGQTGWIEIITPNKEAFVQAFGINNPDIYFSAWTPLINLTWLNRFAVGENDLTGKWSNEFAGSLSYYNAYTGLHASTNTHSSKQNFIFHKNKTYNWELTVAQTATGTAAKINQVKDKGSWKMLSNWQIWFSEMERKPKTYNAYFSCIKGGRVLWLQDASYGDYTAYSKISD